MTSVISARILTYIINLSIKTKIVPDDWKKAILTPPYKDGSPDDPSNYRSIAILPASSKILECLVHDQVMDYVNRHKILSEA